MLLAFVVGAMAPAAAQTPQHVSLYAAGSLHEAMADIAKAFTQSTGIVVDQTFGSSGLLRQRIENGEVADMFASADTASPEQLAREGKGGPVTVFTRNRMCLAVKPDVAGTRAPAGQFGRARCQSAALDRRNRRGEYTARRRHRRLSLADGKSRRRVSRVLLGVRRYGFSPA